MRVGLKHLVGLALLAVVGGLLVAWSGLVSVAASSGHWAVTGWFLHFTMRQAVETQSPEHAAPVTLDDPALVALGAAHYEGGCAPCHGAPGELQRPIALSMTPHPPWLAPVISTWEPQELFWIVQHGVKYSGMPAWPTQHRPDEVWTVVAFLAQLPGLDASAYRRLAWGPEADRPPVAGTTRLGELGAGPLGQTLAGCARCHRRDGAGREEGGVPIVGGQSEAYLEASLRAYAERHRASGIMQPLAAALGSDQLAALARHYAAEPWRGSPATAPADPDLLARGREIATAGLPTAGVPPCASCHGPPARYPRYPRIAGQDAGYLARQVELFRDGVRGGTAFAHLMHAVARGLTDEDIAAVALFYGRQAAVRRRRRPLSGARFGSASDLPRRGRRRGRVGRGDRGRHVAGDHGRPLGG
jgi:cytochrome c553